MSRNVRRHFGIMHAFLLFKAELPEASKTTYTQKCTLLCKYKLIRSSLCTPWQTLSNRCCCDETWQSNQMAALRRWISCVVSETEGSALRKWIGNIWSYSFNMFLLEALCVVRQVWLVWSHLKIFQPAEMKNMWLSGQTKTKPWVKEKNMQMEISPICLKVSLFLKDKVSYCHCQRWNETSYESRAKIQFSRRDCFSRLCSILQNSLYPRRCSSRDWRLHRLQCHSHEPRPGFGHI